MRQKPTSSAHAHTREAASSTLPAKQKREMLQQEAARLLGEDELSDQQIASRVGIGRATLSRWKHLPHVAQMIRDRRETYAEEVIAKTLRRARRESARRLSESDLVRRLSYAFCFRDRMGRGPPS